MSERASTKGRDDLGWLYLNPDTGVEWSEQHPIESGECPDAEEVRPGNAVNLHHELIAAWDELARLKSDRQYVIGFNAGWEEAIAQGWREVEPPQDGDTYLFHDPVLGVIHGHWYDGDDDPSEAGWVFQDFAGDYVEGVEPDAWMPLPARFESSGRNRADATPNPLSEGREMS